jgi:hypothetical protein
MNIMSEEVWREFIRQKMGTAPNLINNSNQYIFNPVHNRGKNILLS